MQTDLRADGGAHAYAPTEHEPTQWQRIEHHTRTLDRAVRMTQMADGKVAPVLALHASLAAITVSQSTGMGSLLTGSDTRLIETLIGWALLLTYVGASLMAFRQVALIYIPTAPHRGRRLEFGHSVFYFDDIQHMPPDEFERRSVTATMDELERDVIRQTHVVASVASRKLAGVQQAYVFSGLTLGAWMPLVVLDHL